MVGAKRFLYSSYLVDRNDVVFDEEGIKDIEQIKDELADVLIYSYMLADNLNLDIDELIERKLIKNNEKYPVAKSKDKKDKYTEL